MSSSVFYFIEHGGSYFLLFMLEKRKKRNIQLILLCTFDGKSVVSWKFDFSLIYSLDGSSLVIPDEGL